MSLGFNVDETKVFKDLLIEHDFTNAIFFGRTGSGKTSCAILPNIENRIKSDYGVLVYDFKGNLHTQVKHLALKYKKLDDIIEIGKPWAAKINLCDYLSVNDLSQIVPVSNDLDNYWDSSARKLFEVVYKIYKDLNYLYLASKEIIDKLNLLSFYSDSAIAATKYFINIPSYNEIYKCLKDIPSVKDFYKQSEGMCELLDSIYENNNSEYVISYKKILADVKDLIKTLDFYKDSKVQDNSGKNAVANHLSSILMEVAKKEYLNVRELDLIKELRAGKIVIVDVSTFNENTLNIFNLAIYTRLQKAFYTQMNPVSIFIDEAQKVLNADYLPQVDVCRESKFEYIFATQDEVLLENKLGKSKFAELYSNIISKYSFTTNNNDIKNKFEFVNLSTNRKAFAKPLFFKKEELLNTEYLFQKDNGVFNYTDYEQTINEIYILKYDDKLIEDYKVLIENINGSITEATFLVCPRINIINENIEVEIDEQENEQDEYDIFNNSKKPEMIEYVRLHNIYFPDEKLPKNYGDMFREEDIF